MKSVQEASWPFLVPGRYSFLVTDIPTTPSISRVKTIGPVVWTISSSGASPLFFTVLSGADL